MISVTAIGNLGADAELKTTTTTNKPYCSFRMGCSNGGGKESGTTWLNCTIFGERANSVASMLTKGKKIAATGTLKTREYDKDGVKKTTVDMLVSEFEFTAPKEKASEDLPF